MGLEDLLNIKIDGNVQPWAKSIQDILRLRNDGELTEVEAMQELIIAACGGVMDLEARMLELGEAE